MYNIKYKTIYSYQLQDSNWRSCRWCWQLQKWWRLSKLPLQAWSTSTHHLHILNKVHIQKELKVIEILCTDLGLFFNPYHCTSRNCLDFELDCCWRSCCCCWSPRVEIEVLHSWKMGPGSMKTWWQQWYDRTVGQFTSKCRHMDLIVTGCDWMFV